MKLRTEGRWRWAGALALLPALASAAGGEEDAVKKAVDESRRVAIQVSRDLRNQLVKEMQLSGPLRSMVVCKYTCPEILSAPARRTGWRIAAVSLRPRNPALGTADDWEQNVILGFERRVAQGEPADGLEVSEVVTQPMGRVLRYARAMPVDRMCVTCHGAPESLPEKVRTQLAADYPFDKAVGFAAGQVYGILSVIRSY